jgi:hypothetical protein
LAELDKCLVAEGGKAAVSPSAELEGRNRWIQAGRALEVTTKAVAVFADAVFKREHNYILASASPAVQAGLKAAASVSFTQYTECKCVWKPFNFRRFFQNSLSPSTNYHAKKFGPVYDAEGLPTTHKSGQVLDSHFVEKLREHRVDKARQNGIPTPDVVSKANDVKILQDIKAAPAPAPSEYSFTHHFAPV